MISTVDYISVKNNEILTSDLILKSIKEKKIIYLYNESNKFEKFLIDLNFDGPAVILQSSGSSKKSKLCIHKIQNLNNSAEASGDWLKSQGFNLSESIIFNALPLYHISGFMALWRSEIWKSEYINISPNLLKNTKDLIDFSYSLKNINQKKLITSLVPTQLFRLLQEKNGLNWLKMFDLIWIGGSKLSNNLFEKSRKENINLAPCYGTTETAAMVTSLKPSEFLNGHKNYGRILTDTQLRINNDGIIEISSERIGYELKRNKNIRPFTNQYGWWESGDYGKLIKKDNFYYLEVLGRKDNAFQSGGETVFPDVLKNRINEFICIKNIPIKELLICKKEDKLWGNRFEIILNFDYGISQKEIKNSIILLKKFSKNWPSHERPIKWIVAKEKSIFKKTFPKTWKNNL